MAPLPSQMIDLLSDSVPALQSASSPAVTSVTARIQFSSAQHTFQSFPTGGARLCWRTKHTGERKEKGSKEARTTGEGAPSAASRGQWAFGARTQWP